MKKHPNYQKKSREELTTELLDYHSKYYSLRELYDNSVIEKQRMDLALSRLNKFSIELLNLSPLENLEVTITRMIKEITGARGAVFSSYHPETKSLNVQHIELEPGLLEKVLNLLGTQVKKISSPVSDEMFQLMITEIIGVRETLNEASFGTVSRSAGAAIQKLLRVDRFIGIVYLIEGKFYGTTLLGMGKGQPDPPRQILENIIFLAAVTLKRKNAEDAISDSEERFRILFEGSPDAILLTDLATKKVLYANKAASPLLLKKNDEIIGMSQFELHIHQPSDYIKMTYERLQSESDFLGFTRPFENTILRSDGKLIPVEISAQTIFYKGQKILMSSFRDISERKQAETVMRQVLSELQTLIDNVQQGILLEDEETIIQYANKKFCELFGIPSPKAVQGFSCKDIAQQAKHVFLDPDEFIEIIDKRLAEQVVVLSEEIQLADGRIFERDYIPVLIEGKKCKNYWIYRDVSERKHSEISLRESQSQISALLKALPDMLFIQDPNGNYIDYHAPEGTQLYVKPEEFLGKNMNQMLPPEIAGGFQKVFEKALMNKGVHYFEYALTMPDGPAYFESRTIAYACDKVLSLVRDISQRKGSEMKIQDQIQELRKLNEDKNRFMSILAHDLKSPFNSILGLLRLLSENLHKYDAEKTQKLINTVKHSSEHFYQLLESLLLWARSQSGKMSFEPLMVKFSDVCNEIIEEVRLNADAKNIAIKIASIEEEEVFADLEMLNTILRNLIANAVKFTNRNGAVEISLKSFENYVRIEVKDNGIGIESEKINLLFDISSFHRLKGTAGEVGTGLGLFLCRELVEKHGGSIYVESEPEKGSRFSFSLPKFKNV